jgi:hypothetical protein
MTHFLREPRLLEKIINKKQQQLKEIQEDLDNLPLDHSSRPRLLERMLHLQNGIPGLEAEYGKLLKAQLAESPVIPPSSKPKNETPLEFLQRGGSLVAKPRGDMERAIADTYKLLLPCMKEAQSIVRSSRGKITASGLKRKFKNTDFVKALDMSDWKLLIEEFSEKRPAGCRNLLLGVLARRTGKSSSTVATYTRPGRKRKKTGRQ